MTTANIEPSPASQADPVVDTMVGSLVAGKYELTRLLGRGGMGAVYEGRNNTTLKRCAVKVLLSPEFAQHPQIVKRFFREARASSVIESDHIVQVYDSGVDPQTGLPYMVMELMNGEDLEATVKHYGALQPLAAGKFIYQAAMGLAKAHEQHIVHRDIKPANLFVTKRESGDLVVKILDFGIAKVKMENFSETSSGMTREGSMLGTPLYMSPEQAKGAANIDVRSDVWSLGVVLYELLSGSLPYGDANSLGELMVSIITADIPLLQDKAPWVPPELAEIAHRAMSRDINRRFQNAGELRDALAQVIPDGSRLTPDMLGGIPPTQRQFVAPRLQLTDDGMLRATTRTGLTITQDRPAKKKSKAPIVLSAVVGVLLVGGGAVFALTRKPPPKEEPSTAAAPATAAPANDKVNVSPVVKRFDLKITVPSGAEVKVDGEKQSVVGGKLELNGSPGSTRKVVIQVGDQVEETTVAITETGLVPPSVEHKAPAPVAAAARPGKARPGPAQAASKPTTAAAESSKPAKKVQVETGMDEFK